MESARKPPSGSRVGLYVDRTGARQGAAKCFRWGSGVRWGQAWNEVTPAAAKP